MNVSTSKGGSDLVDLYIYIYIFSFPGVDGVPDVQHKDVSHKSSTDEEVGLFLCSR